MCFGLLELGGYVLAGGRSSRMGRNKALLELRGRPLVGHAVEKLGRFCREVRVLSREPTLAAFAPVVADLHPGCGPLGGIETALAGSGFDWNLILPVDVPFVPTALLRFWASATIEDGRRMGTRLSMFSVAGRPQPALLMAHRDLLPFVSEAVREGRFKLLPVLEEASERSRAGKPAAGGVSAERTSWAVENSFVTEMDASGEPSWRVLTEAQQLAKPLWFANLNTPEDFAAAEDSVAALDT